MDTAVSGQTRVLVLTASMGGGHMQVSRELARRLAGRGHRVEVADVMPMIPAPAGPFFRWLYPWMVNHAPWLYDAIYRWFFLGRQEHAERVAVPVRLATPRLRRRIAAFEPDVVVSTYHLAGAAAARLRARGELTAAAVTFVTTFGVHNLWLHPATDSYLCITEDVAKRIRQCSAAPVVVCEPVVRPEFTASSGGCAPCRDSGGRRALVVAGSLGLGPIEEAATTIASLPGWEAVVVCGHNEGLRERLAGRPRATTLGWVDDMAALMRNVDVVIDNAAGSTAKEALAVGVPVVTYRPIAGHGRDDALMMQRAGLTTVVDDRTTLAEVVNHVTQPDVRAERVRRGRACFGADPTETVEHVVPTARVRVTAA